MGTHWTDKRAAVAAIGEELARRGWTLYGYREDQSDLMTDYYCPATWAGVAERGDFVVCVDVSAGTYNQYKDGQERISEERDEDCPHCNGTGAEPDGWTYAQALEDPRGFHRHMAKATGSISLFADVVGPASFHDYSPHREKCHKCNGRGYRLSHTKTVKTWPTFHANQQGSKWHVERGGVILAKGSGIYAAAHDNAEGKTALQRICDKIEGACRESKTA